LDLERQHLLGKLRVRSPQLYRLRRRLAAFEPHPLFRMVPGGLEPWERRIVVAPLRSRRSRR
jgi:hypothetical protein